MSLAHCAFHDLKITVVLHPVGRYSTRVTENKLRITKWLA